MGGEKEEDQRETLRRVREAATKAAQEAEQAVDAGDDATAVAKKAEAERLARNLDAGEKALKDKKE